MRNAARVEEREVAAAVRVAARIRVENKDERDGYNEGDNVGGSKAEVLKGSRG